jgi:hypothetical protein
MGKQGGGDSHQRAMEKAANESKGIAAVPPVPRIIKKTRKEEHHSKSDTISIGAILLALLLYVLIPSVFFKGIAILMAAFGSMGMAYTSF